jgi:hypothetical protein
MQQARADLRIQERKAEEASTPDAKSPLVRPSPHLSSPCRHVRAHSQEHAGSRRGLRLRGLTRHASQTDGPELREEVEDGAIDEIISEMKTSAYRRPEAGVSDWM